MLWCKPDVLSFGKNKKENLSTFKMQQCEYMIMMTMTGVGKHCMTVILIARHRRACTTTTPLVTGFHLSYLSYLSYISLLRYEKYAGLSAFIPLILHTSYIQHHHTSCNGISPLRYEKYASLPCFSYISCLLSIVFHISHTSYIPL